MDCNFDAHGCAFGLSGVKRAFNLSEDVLPEAPRRGDYKMSREMGVDFALHDALNFTTFLSKQCKMARECVRVEEERAFWNRGAGTRVNENHHHTATSAERGFAGVIVARRRSVRPFPLWT